MAGRAGARGRRGRGSGAGAEPVVDGCIGSRRAVVPGGHWRTAHAGVVLGSCLVGLERYAEAEPLLLSSDAALAYALGRGHARAISGLDRIIELYDTWGRDELAEIYRAKLDRATGRAGG